MRVMGPNLSIDGHKKPKSNPQAEVQTNQSNSRDMKPVDRSQPRKSDAEIRAKIEELKTGRAAKKATLNTANKQTSEFMKPETIKPPATSLISEKQLQSATVVTTEPATPSDSPIAKAPSEHVPPEEGHLLKSDVGSNNPDDPATAEKLKGILSSGGFSFNEKERATLAKILGE